MSPAQVVMYRVDDETVAQFEITPMAGFVPAGTGEVVGRVRDASAPAIKAAQAVLEQVKQLRPDAVEVKFGVQVSGTANWFVARAATEASFEVTLSWKPTAQPGPSAGASVPE